MHQPQPSIPAIGRLAVATALVAAATIGALALGAVLPYQLGGVDDLSRWWAETPPDGLAVHASWLALVAVAGYLTLLHLLALTALALRWAGGLHLAERASLGLISRLAAGPVLAGLGGVLLTGVPASAAPLPSALGAVDPPVMRLINEDEAAEGPTDATARSDAEADPQTEPTMALVPLDEAPVPLMELLPTGTGALPPVDPTGPLAAQTPPAPQPPGEPAGGPLITATLDRWIVRPGDNLWDIAEAVLQERSGTPADLDAVEGYWLRLIDANRQHLADPTNPDLLFSGQQLELPPR